MNKGLVLRIIYFTSFFVLVLASVFIYPHMGINSEQQSNPSGGKSWNAPASADNLKNPLAGNLTAVNEGKNLFNTYCTICHGNDGKGDGPQAAGLNVKPKDLTAESVKKESDGAVFWKISNGNPPMLAWKYTLSEKQRWELVDYIRQIENK